MAVLVWVSVALLVALLALFFVWIWREPQTGTPRVRNTFIAGTATFFVLFVVFSIDTLQSMPRATHAERLTPSVEAGKLAWQKYLCVDCHTILGNGAYYAADLTRSWNRFVERAGGDERAARASLVTYLQHPPGATSSRRGMPATGMSTAEAASIADFLKWTSEIDTNDWPPAPPYARKPPRPVAALAVPGKALFASAGCTACHSLGGGTVVGPDLAGAASKYDRATLIQWMRAPQAIYEARGTIPVNAGFAEMPALDIDDRDAAAIADFLIAARSQS